MRRFVLNDTIRDTSEWKYAYSLVLHAVHDGVKNELENEGNSFNELPEVYGNNRREFAAHSLALVHHHMLLAQESERKHDSKLEDIHRYCGMLMGLMGEV